MRGKRGGNRMSKGNGKSVGAARGESRDSGQKKREEVIPDNSQE